MTHKVVVTGAAGFVGSHVSASLASAGYQVIATDIVEPSAPILEMLHKASITGYEQGDLTDAKFTEKLLASATGIVHGAGVSRVSIASKYPVMSCQSSSLATTQLLSSMDCSSTTWFILLSSRAVEALEQDCQVQSRNDLYSVLKQNTELLTQCMCLDAKIPLQICRLSDVYGSLLDHKKKLLSTFIDKALKGESLSVYDTKSPAYFTHIDDVTEAVLSCIKEAEQKKIYFRLSRFWERKGITPEELAYLVQDIIGKAIKIKICEPDILSEDTKQVKDEHYRSQSHHFQERVKFKQGLSSLINQYKESIL